MTLRSRFYIRLQLGMTPAEIDYLNIYGDLHRERLRIQDVSPERLIYRA